MEGRCLCWLICLCQFDKLKSPGKGEPRLRNGLHQLALRACLWGICWISGCCGKAQCTVHNTTTPGQVVMGCIRKQTEPTVGSEPGSCLPPWSLLPFLEHLPWLLLMVANKRKPNKRFPMQAALGQCPVAVTESRPGCCHFQRARGTDLRLS